MEGYEKYLKNIVEIINKKRKMGIGYVIVGEQTNKLQQDIINVLEEKNVIISSKVNFHDYENEDTCIAALKKAKKQLKDKIDPEKILILSIEHFECLNDKVMAAIRVLMECPDIKINILISSKDLLPHLIGVTEYMISVYPCSHKKICSEFFRYSTEKTLFSYAEEGGEGCESECK